MDGLLNIDKPLGLTSHDVVQQVRRLTGVRRVGHAGTLDPLATGVLVLGLGRATRLLEYVVGCAKVYETTVRLGQTTTTYDAEGEIIAERPVAVETEQLRAALTEFVGDISQIPPQYAAVKIAGTPLYRYARRGETVAVPPRLVSIHALELLGRDGPEITLRVACSSGVYIRSLAHDLGERLGCGGHVIALRRTQVGAFAAADALPLDALHTDNWRDHLLPPERAVVQLPELALNADQTTDALCGRRLARRSADPDAPLVRAHAPDGRLVGVLTAAPDGWQPHKILLDAI